MPNLGFGEILLILVLALVIFGPRRLPEMGRSIGRSMREFRRAASDLRAEIETDLDVEEPPRVPARSARSRAAATGTAGAAPTAPAAEEPGTPGEDTKPPSGGDPTSKADRTPSSGESSPD
jgi:sec-independent protein translocase protein TatA